MARPRWLAVFQSRRMAVLFLFGFSSGLPLYLTGSTLQAWLTSAGVDLGKIATFNLVGLAYTLKFAWAPLLDRYRMPFLGRRRGWVLVTQLLLMIAIVAMGLCDPVAQPAAIAVLAVIVAFLSSSQDIVLDAYNADILEPDERAAGAAVYVIGYRVAMLVTGTLALFLADFIPWSIIYGVIGALLLIGVVATLIAAEPAEPKRPAASLVQAVYLPFVELFGRLGARLALGVLVFVAIYMFNEYFAQALLIAFFKRGLGFEFREIATIYKVLGFAGMFIGGFGAGTLVARFGLRKMLVGFGILQAGTMLMYAWLAVVGPSYVLFSAAVLSHITTSAMATAAFVAFLMSVCSPGVSATQFALLTSLSSVGQRVFGPFAGDIVVRLSWPGFGKLAASSATIEHAVRPSIDQSLARASFSRELFALEPILALRDALASIDWAALAALARTIAGFQHALVPRGDDVVLRFQWVTFFVFTAVVAIPGILMVFVVVKESTSRPRDGAAEAASSV